VDGGPGTTGNITPPNLVSLSDLNAIALIVSLPNLAIQFGYGYALNAAVSIPVATTIELFASSAPVGSISFTGTPDPIFTGGYGGVASDTPFDRAVLTFSDVGDALRSIMWPLLRTELRTKDRGVILLSAGVSVLLFRRTRRGESRFSYHSLADS
jgi:hypothetical protein